ncbi:MAG TPA: multicopper oxidase domain-containing protein [Geobacteraceae bacterium]
MALPIVSRGELPPDEKAAFHKFVCPPTNGGIKEVDPLPPTFTFRRNLLVNFDLELPDMGKVPMWIIEDPDAPDAPPPLPQDALRRNFPSATIRIPQGALVHADVLCQGNTHTIHWHGIEPTPMNDGVGHTSFEVGGHFFYQFQPRDAGTYFYHCHKNTVLHFEMGLYGMLLVDPPDPAHPDVPVTYKTGGPGFAARFNPLAIKPTDHAIRYDVEAIWAADSIDSRWHTLGHNAFMQKCDANDPVNPENFSQDGFLNDYRPDIFLMTGIPRRKGDPTAFTVADNPLFGPLVAPTVKVGQTLLLRVLNADYIIHRVTLGIDAEVIGADGRAFGVPPFQQYSRPFPLPAGTPFRLTSAMRNDLTVKPTKTGTFPATVEFLDQITGELLYTARTSITVTP